ncbi:MAG: DUF445 family protein [Candidatus Riflebacteria bacterium]|nr:DUF445 family protein [Candidatus Riflebacteria bacterium]
MDIYSLVVNPVTIGFVIGYVTNDIAVIMLFRPHHPMKIGWLGWQGLIPARQSELAEKIATIVTGKLLTSDKIAERLSCREVSSSIEMIASDSFMHVFETSECTLLDLIETEQKTLISEMIEKTLTGVSASFNNWLKSDECRELLVQLAENFLSRKVGDLTKSQNYDLEEELKSFLLSHLKRIISDNSFTSTLDSFIARLMVDFANSLSPIEKLISSANRELIENEAVNLSPAILSKIEEIIFTEENILKIRLIVRDAVESEINRQSDNPNGFEQILSWSAKNLFRNSILQKVDEATAARIPEFRKTFSDPVTRNRLDIMILQFIDALLKKTPGELVSAYSPHLLDHIFKSFSEMLENWIKSESFASELSVTLEKSLSGLKEKNLKEIISGFGIKNNISEEFAAAFPAWFENSGQFGAFFRDNSDVVRKLLNVQISAIVKAVGRDKVEDILKSSVKKYLPHFTEKLPDIMTAVNMEKIVRDEISSYPPEKLEELVLSVCKRELKMITLFGGILGALIGILQIFLVKP